MSPPTSEFLSSFPVPFSACSDWGLPLITLARENSTLSLNPGKPGGASALLETRQEPGLGSPLCCRNSGWRGPCPSRGDPSISTPLLPCWLLLAGLYPKGVMVGGCFTELHHHSAQQHPCFGPETHLCCVPLVLPTLILALHLLCAGCLPLLNVVPGNN